MKKIIISSIILLCSIPLLAQKSGRQIMEMVDEQTNLPNEYQEMEMIQVSKNGKTMNRLMKMYIERVSDNRKSLIVFTSPSDIEGSAFLTLENNDRDDDNWLYLPILRRTRRISSSDITDKFMGSDFTYEDLEEEDINDFTYKYMGDEKVNGSDTYKLEAVPHSARKKEETGYSKRVIYVDKKANLMVKVLYYDNNGNHSKTYEAGNIKPVAGTDKYRCYHMQMTDISKDHVTKLEFTKIKIDNDFSDQLFTRRTLEAGL